ncbi:uncharacterized protein RCC_03496 [Ramularia collo-cygni]|uniref:DUF2415 domain-containing protein n=1 Tax=Ramularia collo-cygni TaxID=112498 RepID=A0A2D3V843_9PEZI|nr:uncharacterized protein RCC_03496 [Ramularia collo-cygni]CZT17659.1 uncharacterized protein RCC_03496 [Ramularia collo-cygni]
MAVDPDPIPNPETHNLAHANKRFYRVKIPVSHWQLRHYISTTQKSLYYASGKQVYHLNTETHRRTHLATLPFDARCTASAHGWVCVGGEEEGHFATIQLHSNPARAPTVKIERIGEEIVNSISIHRLQDEEAHLDDIVAILTNNDQTVRIYSLPAGQETRVKDLPFAINHATLSPDGKMLVAVGDFNQAYFFTREILEKTPQIPKPHNRLGAKDVDWVLTNVVSLHVSESTMGYFTTAWSPNGRLVAVGSEGGYITVLDRDLLERRDVEDDDAVVAVVAGSRADVPSPYPGAIRSMVFSPEPWDLLVWAEDQGRVCIGDLRTGLKERQVIQLEPEDEALERLVVEDVTSEGRENEVVVARLDDLEEELLRRYEQGNTTTGEHAPTSSVNFATEYIETRRRQRAARQELALRQDQRNELRGLLDTDSQGLTTREHQILETLRTSRQREEARASGGPSSINYPTAELFGSAPRPNRQAPPSSTATSSNPRPVNELLQEALPTLARASSLRPVATTTTAEAEVDTLPPIQFSVVRAASNLPRATEGSSSTARSRLPRIQQATTPAAADDDDENPWRTIEEHMMDSAAPAGRGPLFEGAARAPAIPATTADEEASQRASSRELRIRERWRTMPSRGGVNGATSMATSTRRPTAAAASSSETETSQRQAREAILLAASLAEARENRLQRAESLIARNPPVATGGREPLDVIGERYDALFRASLRTGGFGFGGGMGRDGGVRTAGLAISEDGGRVWCACERGIFEVRVRLRGRMSWGATEMR